MGLETPLKWLCGTVWKWTLALSDKTVLEIISKGYVKFYTWALNKRGGIKQQLYKYKMEEEDILQLKVYEKGLQGLVTQSSRNQHVVWLPESEILECFNSV